MGALIPSKSTLIASALIVAVVILALVPSNDYIYLPAPAENIDPHITVSGHRYDPHRGKIYITFVNEPRATLLTTLVEQLNPQASIYTPQQLFGNAPPPSQQQQQQQSVVDMMASKEAAPTAAFLAAGYKVARVETIVEEIDPKSHAGSVLAPGDVLLSIDGHTLTAYAQVQHLVQALKPGTVIHVTYRRGSAGGSGSIQTISLGGHAAIGIYLTYLPVVKNPPTVRIDSGDIEGPSAGLMFALAIYNRLSPADITHGERVAGTGEIDPLGNVGPIGGIKQKIIGAKDVSAKIFFVPAGNWDEAKPYDHGITLVKVDSLGQAIGYLKRLPR